MRVTLDSFCLFASLALALTLFSRLLHHPTHQIRPSSVQKTKKQKKGKETHPFLFEYTPAATSLTMPPTRPENGGGKGGGGSRKNNKKQRSTNIPTRRQTDTRHKAERRHTRTHLPDTQRRLTDKHTKRSTAQPEVYFMQEYSKVCFTIQLNIKGRYIPLWSLTPQWTNPRHPPIHLQRTQKVAERHC